MNSGTSFASLFFFAGDIGGQMGLFIGASILTILELIDYLYEVKKRISIVFLWSSVLLQQNRMTCWQNFIFHTVLPCAQGRVLASMTNALSLTTLQPISAFLHGTHILAVATLNTLTF